MFPGTPFDSYDADKLDSGTEYDRYYSNRKVAYYGNLPYRYPGGFHSARDIKSNPYLAEIISSLQSIFPDSPQFNSFMITKYDSNLSHIPPHSDDEASIEPNSVIMTISLGAPRPVVFRRKPPGDYERLVLTPSHGSLYMMTRASQDLYDHSVPRIDESEYRGTRISITCRVLRQTPTAQKLSTSPVKPKRVLILSDSKNSTFDCSLLKEPVIVFRKNLFYLRDLDTHHHSIKQADLVLVSAGINDLRNNRADPWTLHDHIKHFVSQYSDTQFLFDSITPLSIYADRFNAMNNRISHLNELVLELSLRSRNIKLFDNVQFGLSHLASDGIHLNQSGKSVLSGCWVYCILLTLGLKKGPLPLRRDYANIVDRFYSSVR